MHGFDQDAEKTIKKVKQALDNGEGCRVCFLIHFWVCTFSKFVERMITLKFIAGLWGFRCPKGCWEFPYVSSRVKHFRCTNGQYFFPL